MKKQNLLFRIVAFLMAIILAIPSTLGNFAVTAYAAETEEGETTAPVSPVSEESSGPISIELEWMDSEFKDGTAFNLVEDSNVTNVVKMKVSYSSELVKEEGYAPGELIITVKGIGNVNRSGPIEAVVGADKEGSSVKNRDWSYTWNKANDTYTLTNNEAIKGNSVFSGYFELVWTVDARDSIEGYSQDDLRASIILPDGDNVSSEALSFTNDTTADTYEVFIGRNEMYSYEGLTDGIENPDDYAFVRYNLAAVQNLNSRGLKSYTYIFDPDSADIGSGAIVISPKLTCVDNKDGTYTINLRYLSSSVKMEDQYIFVAYPKSSYADTVVTAEITKYGQHFEGDDLGNTDTKMLAEASIDVPVPNDFSFSDDLGDIYAFHKDTYYDQHVSYQTIQDRGGDIPGYKMQSGTTERFYLEGALKNGTVSAANAVSAVSEEEPVDLLEGSSEKAYTLEMVDDFLYIMKNNGDFRQLEKGEYAFKNVVIPATSSMININGFPIESDKYEVKVYAFTDGEDGKVKELVFQGKLQGYAQNVALPANTTAIAIEFINVTESINGFSIPVDIEFHIKDTSDLEFEQQDNLTSGQVVNTSYIKVYDADGNWFNNYFTQDNYLDDTNLKLAQKDIDIYGSYLDRERDNITFYPGEKSDYFATTRIDDIKTEGSRLVTQFTMGANFTFTTSDRPNKFSLYTILDKALYLSEYVNEEDIWDIMSLSGLNMSSEQLAAACTPEVITDYNGSGRTYIALHFDFGDAEVPQKGYISATFDVTVNKDYFKQNYTIRGKSAVMIDTSITEFLAGKNVDDGQWGDTAELFNDIDRDGNTEGTLDYYFDSIFYVYADSSQLSLTKYVKTTYSVENTQLPDVPYEEFGGSYQYTLYLKNGNSQATNIVIRDILETGSEAQWQGTFQSLDLSACEKAGLSGTVYYSSSDSPSEDLTGGDWTTEQPATVKAIAVDFGDSVLKESAELNIVINMKAPEDSSLKDQITENSYSASFTMLGNVSGEETASYDLDSNPVQVKLTPVLRSIILTKVDAESGEQLSGAKFALINKQTGEIVAEATSNEKGYAIFRQVPAYDEYIIRELEAPYGYETVADVEVAMNGTDQRITVKDPRKTGRIEVVKVSDLDDDIPVANAEYTLYDANDNVIASATTDAKGIAVFENVAWGSYKVKETASPAGYHLNETEYPVEFNRENVTEKAVIGTFNVQEDVSLTLKKYEKLTNGEQTNNPVPGATFELLRKVGEIEQPVGLYVTDANGRVDLVDLPYGDYIFREYRTPVGYVTGERVEFTISPDNKEVTVTAYNQRKPGMVTIIKKDNLGNFIENVEFSLYDRAYSAEELKEAAPIRTVRTDEYGLAQIDNLEWGTYYILETDAPDYYQMDTQWKEVTIGAKSLNVSLEVINETVKGSVLLTKTDEAGITFLNGAEYTLYTEAGAVVGVYTTENIGGLDGKVLVEGLEWGSYYFKETKAPAGYSLSDETVRFSVNSLNAGLTQEIKVTDPLNGKSITLTKRILASDVNFDNGNPSFLFKVEGVDVDGVSHTYKRVVTFDKAYVEANTDAEGYVSLSVTIANIKAGQYTATEMQTSRYYLEGISDAVNGTITGDAVVFDLSTDDIKDASAVFTNRNYEQQDFSDAQVLTNVLKQKAKLTALKVVYDADTAEAESALDRDLLTVTAIYDDGSSRVLSDHEYELDPDITTFPNQNGDYTVTVSYEENDITRTGTFKVTLYGMKIRIIRLEAVLNDPNALLPGTELTPDMFTVTAVYNDGNRAVITDFTVSPETVPAAGGEFDAVISLDLNKIPNGGKPVSETLTLTPKYPDPILVKGSTFASKIPSAATAVEFTNEVAPKTYSDGTAVQVTDVSAAGDGSVVAWLDEGGVTWKVSSQRSGAKVIANNDCSSMFYGKSKLTSIDFSNLDTSQVTNMNFMFRNCSKLTELDLSSFNTSQVTTMRYMFGGCSSLTQLDLSSFDTSKVTDMSYMFYNYGFAQLDLSSFNTSQVTNMSYMFYGCSLTQLDLSSFDTSKVTNMANMFYKCNSLTQLNLSSFNTSQVTNMANMFSNCGNLTELDLSSFNTSQVTNMSYMFNGCANLTRVNLRSFDTSKVTDMRYMFYNCSSLTELEFRFNTSQVTNMSYMFYNCSSLTQLDLSSFDTSKVTDMSYMFCNSSSLTRLTFRFNTSQVTNMANMFNNCKSLTELDLSSFNTSQVTRMSYMFYTCKSLTQLDLSSFDTSKVTDMNNMFTYCSSLTQLDLSSFNTSKVTNMYNMFNSCSSLTQLDLSSFNTSKVTNMGSMFQNCKNLTQLDLSSFDTSQVTSMSYMFYSCSSLTELDLSSFDTSQVTIITYMFYGCSKAVKGYARTQADADKFNGSNGKPAGLTFESV